jgi:phage-related protein
VATAVVIFSFRDQIADAFRGLADLIVNPESGLIASVGGGWNLMMDGISSYAGNILTNLGENWTAFIDTIIGLENGLIARLGQTWNLAMDGMRDYALGLVQPITDAWESIVGTVRGVINSALSLAGRAVNAFIEQVNRLIQTANSVSSAVGGPQLGQIRPVEVPQFAVGGRVDRPTLIMAGEAGTEYIVPQRKVPQFIAAQMGDQGLGIRQGGAAAGISRGGTFAPTIQVQTGPIQQQPDGSQWIRREDAEAMVSDGIGQLWDHIQSYDGRQALGMA